jgi:hypothetical protein
MFPFLTADDNLYNNVKFWEELTGCFPLIRHQQHTERQAQQIYLCVFFAVCIFSKLV